MTREQVAQALYTAEFGPKGFPGPSSKFWAMADAVLALSPPEPTERQREPGEIERLQSELQSVRAKISFGTADIIKARDVLNVAIERLIDAEIRSMK